MDRSPLRLALLPLIVALVGLSGCGYQLTGRAAGEARWHLDVVSNAAEPGLALSARRGMQVEAESFGLWLSPDVSGGPRLEVLVVSARSEAATIHLHPKREQTDPADETPVTTPAHVRATTYDALVVLEARLYATSGQLVATHTVTGSSPFGDGLMPLATSDLRSGAMERAIGVACRELAAWAAGHAGHASRSVPSNAPPEHRDDRSEPN